MAMIPWRILDCKSPALFDNGGLYRDLHSGFTLHPAPKKRAELNSCKFPMIVISKRAPSIKSSSSSQYELSAF